MEKSDKVLIIPDVHGRTFWKDAVKDREDWRIIFLGDYHDPYRYEGITQCKSLENFKEIIEFKKQYEKNVTLLIGNHDCTYCFKNGHCICDCRRDIDNFFTVSELFMENKGLFQMALELNIGDRNYIFSHAPILKNWVEENNFDKTENIVDYFNDCFQTNDGNYYNSLCDVGHFRGGYFYGSMVWADVREIEFDQEELFLDDYAIFGHTQLDKAPIVKNNYACLDCRRAFILTQDGEITELDNTIIPKI